MVNFALYSNGPDGIDRPPPVAGRNPRQIRTVENAVIGLHYEFVLLQLGFELLPRLGDVNHCLSFESLSCCLPSVPYTQPRVILRRTARAHCGGVG